ncbi:unnamed protein product [Gordionus sp. m RMFG-2023]|uniref:5-demethoxyubiquinone hydroxylase, mitochondrial-like isoform X2 n=1 Tax=Gordionus sp. m RMFG-2023 TaxID=3053472 RepID=UPI0030E04B41
MIFLKISHNSILVQLTFNRLPLYILKVNLSNNHKKEKKRELYDRILRVNHAGELGADRIYAGQLCILGDSSVGYIIKHMWEQEKEHLATFENLIAKYNTRPSLLVPFWNVAGYALGMGSAILGKKTAMACTVAVESVISQHYNNQIRELMELEEEETTISIDADDKELINIIKRFRDEEMEHHDTGLEHEAEKAPFYNNFTNVIKLGCKAAIFVAERI